MVVPKYMLIYIILVHRTAQAVSNSGCALNREDTDKCTLIITYQTKLC